MKHVKSVFIVTAMVFVLTFVSAFSAEYKLASGGKSAYIIRLCANPSQAEKYAADELQRFLQEMTGVKLPVQQAGTLPRFAILVGRDAESDRLVSRVNWTELDSDGFVVITAGSRLVLAGGRPRGTLYAVYHFLDNVLGVRWWAPDGTFVPSRPELRLTKLDIRQKPAFEWREVLTFSALVDQDWEARNRLNRRNFNTYYLDGSSNTPLIFDDQHGGSVIDYGPYFVHTFGAFVPADKYLKDHPEWFGLVDGQRAPGLLCLTNPELMDFMVTQVKAALKANPGINIISVSQNDGGMYPCQCPNCRKVDAEEGSPAGSLIRFVNGVAEQVGKEYPHVAITTLAYNYTQKPPLHVRPRSNVVVQLCSSGCSCFQSLDDPTNPANKAFYQDLQGWAKLTDRLYIWDYTISHFRPYPNLHVLGPNVRTFERNHVRGVFEQGSYTTPGAEFQELRSWVLSRLLWNPNQDDRALIREFVSGYYGAGGPYIQEYIDLIHTAAAKNINKLLAGDNDKDSPIVNVEIISKADALFAKAQAAVKDQPAVLVRVKRAYMPIQCMWLTHYRLWTEEAKVKGLPAPAPWQTILADFTQQVTANKVSRVDEGRQMGGFLRTVPGLINPPKKGLFTASGTYGEQRPEAAFDSDPQTAWAAGGFGPQWIQRDFEGPVKIKSITTSFGYGSTCTYQVDGSLDGKTWEAIVPQKTIKGEGERVLLDHPVTVRYVRTTVIDIVAFHPHEWVGMAEQTVELE